MQWMRRHGFSLHRKRGGLRFASRTVVNALPGGAIARAAARLVRRPVRWIDRALLRHYGIITYCDDPGCILRAGLTASPAAVALADGTSVSAGEVVAELHLWNERAMQVFGERVSMGGGIRFRRRIRRSLEEFVAFVEADPRYAAVRAVLVRTSACDEFPLETIEAIANRWGFDIERRSRSAGERFADFFDNVYVALLGLAYPSAGVRIRRRLDRLRIWISRDRLAARFGRTRTAATGMANAG